MTIKAAWLDEAGQMKERVWSIMYGRLNILRGRMIMTTTPYTVCWIDDQVIPQWEKGNKDYLVITYESIASPWFPIEEYNHAKETLSPAEFSRRYKGVMISGEGLVYDGWSNKYVWEEVPPTFHIKEYAAGVDFGYGHAASIEVGAFSDDFPACCIVDEYYERKKTIEELIAAAKEFQKKYKIRIFYADPSRPEYIKQMSHAGLPTMPAKNDVQPGLDRVRSLMYSGNLRVLKRCRGLLEERRKYKYPETGSTRDEPLKFDDDACFTGDTDILTSAGYRPISQVKKGDILVTPFGDNKVLDKFEYSRTVTDFGIFKATPNHHIPTQRGSVRLDSLRYGDKIGIWNRQESFLITFRTDGILNPLIGLIGYIFRGLLTRGLVSRRAFYTEMFGSFTKGRFPQVIRLTTLITTPLIMTSLIWKLLRPKNTPLGTVGAQTQSIWEKSVALPLRGTGLPKQRSFIKGLLHSRGKIQFISQRVVQFVEKNLGLAVAEVSSAIRIAKPEILGEDTVYDLKTEKGMYFANGVLVSNSDAERYLLFTHNVLPASPQEESTEDPIWKIIRDEKKPRNKFEEEISDWLIDSPVNDEVLY